jgi:hypothetical protein
VAAFEPDCASHQASAASSILVEPICNASFFDPALEIFMTFFPEPHIPIVILRSLDRHPEEPRACAASRRMAPRACGLSFEARRRRRAPQDDGGMCGKPSLRGAKRRSNPVFLVASGLLRGACHRARIRATRWLAMTQTFTSSQDDGSKGRQSGSPAFRSACSVRQNGLRASRSASSREIPTSASSRSSSSLKSRRPCRRLSQITIVPGKLDSTA